MILAYCPNCMIVYAVELYSAAICRYCTLDKKPYGLIELNLKRLAINEVKD